MKILYVTTISNTMGFFVEHVKMLYDMGHSVEIACAEGTKPLNPIYRELNCKVHDIPFSRSPFSRGNLKAYKMLKQLVETEHYDIVHTHTPNASMIARLACRKVRKQGTRVFYTAHGFHFFKGAPLKNWLMYYPVEKFCARYTDVLITINKEDYELAQKKIHAKKVCYVPGVGIDLERIRSFQADRNEVRKSMGVPEDCILLLSIGEINVNKNHQVVVKALAKLGNKNVHYAIAGIGDQKENLLNLAKELGVENQFHLLGYRTDVPAIAKSSDIFCFPSHREGLGLAALETMACGLPIVTSNVHGINDYSQDGVTGYKCSPNDCFAWAEKLDILINAPSKRLAYGENNKIIAENFSTEQIIHYMRNVYNE